MSKQAPKLAVPTLLSSMHTPICNAKHCFSNAALSIWCCLSSKPGGDNLQPIPPFKRNSKLLPPPWSLFPPTSQSSSNTLTTTTNPKLQDAGVGVRVGGGVKLLCEVGGQGDIPWIVAWQKEVEDKSFGNAKMIDSSLSYRYLDIMMILILRVLGLISHFIHCILTDTAFTWSDLWIGSSSRY